MDTTNGVFLLRTFNRELNEKKIETYISASLTTQVMNYTKSCYRLRHAGIIKMLADPHNDGRYLRILKRI